MTDGVNHAPETKYTPGSWVAFATQDTWLLVDLDPASPLVRGWWTEIHSGTPSDQVLALILEEGFRAIGSFALITYRAGAGTMVLRGAVSAELTTTDETNEVTPGTVRTWVQQDLDRSLTRFSLRCTNMETSEPHLPLATGVSPASAIEVALTEETRLGHSPVMPAAPVPEVEPEPEPEPEPRPESEPATASSRADDASDDASPTFDHLFGATQRPPDHDPAEEAVTDTSLEPAPSVVAGSETLAPTDTVYPRPASEPAPLSAPSGLIDALPWKVAAQRSTVANPTAAPVASSPAAPQPRVKSAPQSMSTPTSSSPADVDVTVKRDALLAAANLAPHTGPTVQATTCPAGHLNPPYAEACRICHTPLGQQTAVTAPRPVLGTLHLSTGDTVTLDRGVVLGRAPEPPDESDPDRPNVVRLASPENDISRTHLKVLLEGWHVLVVDCGSTNGTVVTLPGQEPVRLRADDPAVIEPGTVVCLADEVTFRYEVTS